MERREIQGLFDTALMDLLQKEGIELGPDHSRRLMRVLMHTAARIAQTRGMTEAEFAARALRTWQKELPTSTLQALARRHYYHPKTEFV